MSDILSRFRPEMLLATGGLLIQLTLLTTINSCTWGLQEASCQKTTRRFVDYFNRQDFRGVATLFQQNALDRNQINSLTDNLLYIYAVAGEIRSMQFREQEDGRITYKSIHENTAMDIIFRVDDQCKLQSYLINTHYPDSLPQLERNITPLSLPFQGDWYVEWGGSTLEQNYHNAHRNMKGAFDFSKRDQDGNLYRIDGKQNEDYYAFGQPVTAPCQATVVKVIDGIEDNAVGVPNDLHTYGNLVVLETNANEFLLIAHLQKQSIVVKEGQPVYRGDLLAHCGNSGYSNAPHLHFILQNVADLFHPSGATCYFDSIEVDGVLRQDYSPVQGEVVSNY